MQFHNFKKQLLVRLGIFLGIVVILVAAFIFLSKQISGFANNIFATRQRNEEQAQINQILADLKKGKEEAVPYINSLRNLIPNQNDLITELPKEIEIQARVYGISVVFDWQQGSRVNPQDGAFGSVNFSMIVLGQLDQIAAFLKYWETRPVRFSLRLDQFDVAADSSGGYKVVVKGMSFFQ
jgi:hypothetical protein